MSDVRAITVREPWAWAIRPGGKDVENRTQEWRYRGRLLIHAGLGWSERGERSPLVRALMEGHHCGPRWPGPQPYEVTGAIVASCELVDVHPATGCCEPWGESEYVEAGGRRRTRIVHLVLEDVVVLDDPVECRGWQGLWRPPSEVISKVEKRIGEA